MNAINRVLALVVASIESTGLLTPTTDQHHGPTIVLVHGVFAASSGRSHVINRLNSDGYVEVGDHGRI